MKKMMKQGKLAEEKLRTYSMPGPAQKVLFCLPHGNLEYAMQPQV